MKVILAAIILSIGSLYAQDPTSGVFYVNNPLKQSTMNMAGEIKISVVEPWKTYRVSNDILEISSTNDTAIYFGGGPLLQVGNESKFTLLSFFQEVKNPDAVPSLAEFGTHTLNLQLDIGEFSIIYPNTNEYSRVNITTHYASYELTGGAYYFRLTGKSALVYVISGKMIVHGNKNQVNIVDEGKLAIAVPFGDAESGLDDQIVASFNKIDASVSEKFSVPVLAAKEKWNDVKFLIYDKKVVGIRLK